MKNVIPTKDEQVKMNIRIILVVVEYMNKNANCKIGFFCFTFHSVLATQK